MTQAKLSGGCLCDAVQYEIEGEAERFYHCHCSRCRRLTGSGQASNLLVKPADCLRWTQGESLLKRYKLPDAEHFYSLFCSQCGSPMPRVVKILDAVLVPAGTLHQEPPIQPAARIFWASRAQWSCQDENLPTFAEYP